MVILHLKKMVQMTQQRKEHLVSNGNLFFFFGSSSFESLLEFISVNFSF